MFIINLYSCSSVTWIPGMCLLFLSVLLRHSCFTCSHQLLFSLICFMFSIVSSINLFCVLPVADGFVAHGLRLR